MGNSTITLQNILDTIESMGDVAPSANPGSYSIVTTLAIANDTLNDLISRRFNWKWNSKLAPVFLTNSFQQDYPMVGITDIGWLESAWWLDINSTVRPIPIAEMEAVRDINVRDGRFSGVPEKVCWKYALHMQLGGWPGPSKTFTPLRGQGGSISNPLLSMMDGNGNILVLTTFGITGATAPELAKGAAEGTTVQDGTCVWTLCSPFSQGFRVSPLPAANTPVYEVHVVYQMKAAKFTSLASTLDPIPDDYAHHFRRGFKAYCHSYSQDKTVRAEFPEMHKEWLASMEEAEQQGEREADSYNLRPAASITSGTMWFRDPTNPARPY